MKLVARRAFALIVLFLCSTVFAGKYNVDVSIGDAAPPWKDLPGVDGKIHSLADLKDAEAIVVVFTCNSCPYAVDYEKRLIDLQQKYAKAKVSLVAINVNKVAEDSLEAMSERAKKQKFNFTYLFDESQSIAREYGAIYTPEFFVLNKKRKVVYMGAMDDSTDAKEVKRHYVEEAIVAIKSNSEPEIKETVAVGCRVRFERTRRRKREQQPAND